MVLSQGLISKLDPALQSRLDQIAFAPCLSCLGIFENSQHVLPQVIAAAALERNLGVGAHKNPERIICKRMYIVRYGTIGIPPDFYPRVPKIPERYCGIRFASGRVLSCNLFGLRPRNTIDNR